MDNDWQNTLPSVKDRNLYAFENSKFSDVEFSVDGEQATIPAHKYMLAINSPVFEAMFYGSLAETTRVIHIPECTQEGLQEMLRYVYTDKATITANNVMELLYLSRKYSMSVLENECNYFIFDHVNPEDVFLVLPQVQKLQNKILEDRCWAIIDKDTRQAVKSQAFLDIPREMLCQILSRDTLEIKELELFKAMDRWVCKKIRDRSLDEDGDTKREILGEDIVRLIRFPTMTMNDFITHVLDCEILQRSELTEILKRLKSLEPATSVFNSTPRSGPHEKRQEQRRRRLSSSSNRNRRSPSDVLAAAAAAVFGRDESDSDNESQRRSRSPLLASLFSDSDSDSDRQRRSRSRSSSPSLRRNRSRSRSLTPIRAIRNRRFQSRSPRRSVNRNIYRRGPRHNR